jgi:hypothetical protein
VYAWSVSYPSSQPHSYGITDLIGDGPISGGQDKLYLCHNSSMYGLMPVTENTQTRNWLS